MKKKLLILTSYLLVSVLSTVLTLGIVAHKTGGVSKLDQLGSIIEGYYIEEADRTALEDAAAEAMIAATGDRWSYYIPAAEYAAYIENQENAYVGIGVTITVAHDGSGLQIMEVSPGSSALEAGLQVQQAHAVHTHVGVVRNGQRQHDVAADDAVIVPFLNAQRAAAN